MRVKTLKPIDLTVSFIQKPRFPFYALALLATTMTLAQGQTTTPAATTPPATTPAQPAANPPAAPATAAPAQTTQPAVTPSAAQPAASGAQQQPASSAPGQGVEAPTIRVQANEVDLVFTVTDKKGHFITGLNQDSFGLLDDGRPPEAVLHFYQQKNLPLRVGIMLDTSSSIRGRFEFEQDSAIEFLRQVLHVNDRAFVEGFDVQLDLAQGFTNDIDKLNTGIKRLRPGGGTALFDALYSTCKDQMLTLRQSTAEGPVRKTLILVSDGDDNYSRALESDAIKECQRAETTIYAISTNVSPSKDKGDDILQAIADATGGRAFFPTRIEDIGAEFISIQEELRSQYLLEYRPANFKQDGSFRTIYLQAHDPRYHVRTHTGYFAPKAAE